MKGKILKYWNSLNKKKKILLSIIVCLTLVELSSLFLMYQSLLNKNSLLDSVSLKNSDKSNGMFAIYLQQEDKSYKESDRTTWPTEEEGYVYSSAKSGCVDLNGQDLGDTLTYDKANNSVSIKTKGAAKCYLYFNIKAIGDVVVKVSTDGEAGLPTIAGYKQNLSCGSDQVTFNQKYQRIEIGESTSCDLTYTKDTETHTLLIDEVENAIGESIIIKSTEENSEYSVLTLNDYQTTDDTGNSTFVNGGFVFDETNNTWTGTASSEGYTSLQFTPGNGYYQICYEMPVSNISYGWNFITINKSSTSFEKKIYSDTKWGSTITDCYAIGYVEDNELITINQYYNGANSTFSINKNTNLIDESVGYRYIGKTPNNYIWFNNEIWRIIGSVPTSQKDGIKTNLIKIIRNDSISNVAYDTSDSSNIWGENTLYTLLNEYYYGKKNGTNSGYCYGTYYEEELIGNCDYTTLGLKKDDYYGKMIEEVYWNTGTVKSTEIQVGDSYKNEKSTQTLGHIGLMNLSDFAFIADKDYYSYDIYSYYSNNIPSTNWLYKEYEWILTKNSTRGYFIQYSVYCGTGGGGGCIPFGGVKNASTLLSQGIRPVVYLDSSVYVLSGTGSITDPYIIGM